MLPSIFLKRVSNSNPTVYCARKQSLLSVPVTFNHKSLFVPLATNSQIRFYSDAAPHALSRDEVRDRVLDVIKAFGKVDASKVSDDSNFHRDLGIDSLDTVELLMALEDEFVIEIPDNEAEKITSCVDAINYISSHPSAK